MPQVVQAVAGEAQRGLLCGEQRVARFQCKTCGKHFSEQTFSPDYRDRKPELGPQIARLLAAGYSQRSSARLLGVNRKTVARRALRLRRERRAGRQDATQG